jgi:hypothetical protein
VVDSTVQVAGEVVLRHVIPPALGVGVTVQVESIVRSNCSFVPLLLKVAWALKVGAPPLWLLTGAVGVGQLVELNVPKHTSKPATVPRNAVAIDVGLTTPCAAAVTDDVPPVPTPVIVAVPPVNEETQLVPETKQTAPGVALVHATPLVTWDLELSE